MWAAEQITYRKQSETKNSTPEIKIVPGAVLEPPMHPRKHMKHFAEVSKNDHH